MAKWTLAKGMTWRMKLEEVHPNHGKLVDTPLSLQKRYGKGKNADPQTTRCRRGDSQNPQR